MYLTLKVIDDQIISDHKCYLIKSNEHVYIGYTTDFSRRIRQHNGEISGGAKKTMKHRPWYPVCTIEGFYESSSALRFEYRLQRNVKYPINIGKIFINGKEVKLQNNLLIKKLFNFLRLINSGDGVLSWPILTIKWYDRQFYIEHSRVINSYDY